MKSYLRVKEESMYRLWENLVSPGFSSVASGLLLILLNVPAIATHHFLLMKFPSGDLDQPPPFSLLDMERLLLAAP